MSEKLFELAPAYSGAVVETSLVDQALNTVRNHLGMEVAYLSEFVGDNTVFRAVSAPGLEHLVQAGDQRPIDQVYCQHIIDGRLPELIPDTSQESLCVSMPITKAVPIGSHMSIPIRLKDGSVYGMFCCLSSKPNASLNSRDLETMRLFAELAMEHINTAREQTAEYRKKSQQVKHLLAQGAFRPVYQPIFDLLSNEIAGFESLCRFETDPYRPPNVWFEEAAETGMGVELENAVIKKAIGNLSAFPDHCYLSFNASPAAVIDKAFAKIMSELPLDRLVLEITEHAQVSDYPAFLGAIEPLRKRGLKLAVDDAGAGYSSLQHIVQVRPDIIKLDLSLVRDVHKDQARRSLANAFIYFARETGAKIVAEGIEYKEELEILKMLGIYGGQGYLLGKPAELDVAISSFACDDLIFLKQA